MSGQPSPEQAVRRGDRFIAYSDAPHPRQRLYIEVTRVARDDSWADIRARNCFVMWTKRLKLPLPPHCVRRNWTQADLDAQFDAWDD